MITFLRKLFVKNYQNVNDEKVRKDTGLLASFGGIFTNTILFVAKLVIGIFTNSMSIISDALNNLGDFFSCIVNLVGIKLSNRPADKDHPFGHQRIEYIASLIISFFIIAMGLFLGYEAIMKLIEVDKSTSFSIASFIILGVAILFKLFLAYFYNGLGNAINSMPIKASKQDSINDAICTTGVLIASIFQYFFPNDIWWLDKAITISVACFIIFSGIKLTIETASPLIGEAPNKELIKSVCDYILHKDGVLGIHDVIAHNYGATKIFISAHVEVDGYQNVMSLHDMIDNIEMEVTKKFKVEITIHMDPLDTKNKLIPELKGFLTDILNKYNPEIKFHDFRMVNGDTHTNLVFDVLVPNDKKFDVDALDKYIKSNFKEKDKKYFCVIKYDTNYVG